MFTVLEAAFIEREFDNGYDYWVLDIETLFQKVVNLRARAHFVSGDENMRLCCWFESTGIYGWSKLRTR